MKLKLSSRKGQVVTAVGLSGGWVRMVQLRIGPLAGRAAVLAVKARKVEGETEEQISAIVAELLRSLPLRAEQGVGLLSTHEILTRYLRLPPGPMEELRAMARYQMEGLLPFPAQECITAVKVLGTAGEAAHVMAAAVHRPVVERLTRICSRAGFSLTGIAASAEAIGSWHRFRLAPELQESVWLSLELEPEGMEIGILSGGSLLYMRQIPTPADLEQLTERIRETLRSYAREQVGPPVQRVVLGGTLEILGSVPLERIESALEMPVRRVDPLPGSQLGDLTFSDLLGAALDPRLLQLDLLPLENRIERARQALGRQIQRLLALMLLAVAGLAGWAGVRVTVTEGNLRRTQSEIAALKPASDRIQAMWASIRSVQNARREYGRRLEWISAAMEKAPAGMTFQFLGFESDWTLTLRGSVADLSALTRYAALLREDSRWQEVQLRSAKEVLAGAGRAEAVEFEMVLR